METRIFRPRFAYALGRGPDATWKQWQELTADDLDAAEQHIDDAEHRAEFAAFVSACVAYMTPDGTLGEAVAKHAAELRQRAASAFGHADELERYARATGRGPDW